MTGKVLGWAAALVLCSAPVWGENLIHNPSFEDDDGTAPADWHVFIMPMFGAEGVADAEVAAEGFRSVRIHVPEPYAEEPANNWSQNLQEDVAGKTVRLGGAIRTVDAGYAGIWLQCCTKRPFKVLRQDSTYDVHPMRGTRGWTRVSMTVAVPEETEFLVVRCVLQGAGTAWFDDLSLSVEETVAKPNPQPAPDSALIAAPASPTVDAVLPERPSRPVRPETPLAPAPEEPTVPVSEIIELNSALQETVHTLRKSNDQMSEELRSHRDEIERLKTEIVILRDAVAEAAKAEAAQAETRRNPPLVPGSNPNGSNE